MGQRVSSPRDETARGEQSHLARLVTGRRSSSTTVQSPLQAEVTSSSTSGQMDPDLPNLNGQRSPTRPGPRLRSGRTRLVHSFHSRDEQQTSRNHPRTVFSNEPVSPADVDMADASDRSPSRRDQDRPRSSILPTTASGSLMPRYAEYGSASNGDMREAHGRSIRRRLSNSVSTSPHGIQEIRPRPRTPREQGAPSPERRRRIAAISGPISVTHQPSQAASTETSGNGNLTDSASRRASRFARVRNSLSLPGLVNLLASNPQDMSGSSDVQSQTSDSIPRTPGDEPAIVPPPQLPMPDLGSDFTQPPTRLSPSNRVLRNNEDLRSTLDEVDGIPRLHDQERVSRRFSSLRGLPAHPAPRIRQTEDQAAMLTRLLSVAAAATAASLVGNSDETLSQAQDLGANGVDGSFDSFLQALRNGGLTAALRNSTQTAEDSNEDAARPAEAPAPLNFFRMFRFGAVSSSNRSNRNTRASSNRRERSTNSDGTEQNGSTEPSESRMVPVIIVGIRSVPSNDGEGNPDNNAPPFLDALANLPLTATTNPWANGNGSSNGLLRRSDARSRIAQRRRASMNGSGTFPASYSSQRHQRTTDSPRAHSDAHNHEGAVNADELIDLQLGSNPPSSSPTRTTRSMQAASVAPTLEPSSSSDAASMVDPEPLPAQVSLNEGTSPSPQEESTESSQTMRHRRRLSDSEAARHRNLGSGSSRRNGVVDPDSGSNSGRADGQRSWIIYVLGGSYPEDHPILTTPSLFTDSPTYEDMLLLSSILGPAKPPVATREDVASAPGVYHITNVPGGLLAQAEEGTDSIQIAPGERCLVCLSDYEDEEMVRQLQKCGHLFHRDCIDEWLTTGRNSCPLCRGQGVQDKRGQEQESTSSQNTAAAGQP